MGLFKSLFKKSHEPVEMPGQEEISELESLLASLKAETAGSDNGRTEHLRLQQAMATCRRLTDTAIRYGREDVRISADASLLEIKERSRKIRKTASSSQKACSDLIGEVLAGFKLASNKWDPTAMDEAILAHQNLLSVLEQNQGWLTIPLSKEDVELLRYQKNVALTSCQLAVLQDVQQHGTPTSACLQACRDLLVHLLTNIDRHRDLKSFMMGLAMDIEFLLNSIVNKMTFLTDARFIATLKETLADLSSRFEEIAPGCLKAEKISQRGEALSMTTGTAALLTRAVATQPGITLDGIFKILNLPQETYMPVIYNLMTHGFLDKSGLDGATRLQVNESRTPDWWLKDVSFLSDIKKKLQEELQSRTG